MLATVRTDRDFYGVGWLELPKLAGIRRISLGAGYRYLMESVAVSDGAMGKPSDLVAYYAASGTPPDLLILRPSAVR